MGVLRNGRGSVGAVRRPLAAASTSSSSRPTRPDRCTSAMPAAPSSATCSAASSKPAGHRVTREYYFNDSGARSVLGASVAALRCGKPVPEDGYQGDYVAGPRAALPDDVWDAAFPGGCDAASSGTGRPGACARASRPRSTSASISTSGRARRGSTTRAGSSGRWSACASGHVYEQDGAMWFRSTDFGDDKDRVIFRSNGEPTYFAADIGYVTEKFSRGFDQLIYIWGADHHGTVARVRNAAEAMGYDRDAVQMLLSPGSASSATAEVSMSKRAGEFITLDELLAEVGVDAARWFFASRAGPPRGSTSTSSWPEAVEREPGLLRPVRPRPDRLDPAQGGRGGPGAVVVRRRRADRGTGGALASGAPPAAGGRRGRGRRRGDAGGHGATRRSWRRRSTPSIATRRSSTRPSPSGRRRAWRSLPPPRRPWPTRSASWGSPHPNRCKVGSGRGRAGGYRQPENAAEGADRRVVGGEEWVVTRWAAPAVAISAPWR